MTIDKVLAVYKTTPIVLVVESAEGPVCELSLRDLRAAGHRLSDGARTSLIEAYRLFTCRPVARECGAADRERPGPATREVGPHRPTRTG